MNSDTNLNINEKAKAVNNGQGDRDKPYLCGDRSECVDLSIL